MTENLTRRKFVLSNLLALVASPLAMARGSKLTEHTELKQRAIDVVSWEPYVKWLGKPIKRFDADYVELPWKDSVLGGADPFIGVTTNGDIYATAASVPKLLKSTDGGRTWTRTNLTFNPPLEGGLSGGIQNFGILQDDTFIIGYQVKKKYHVARSENFGKTWNRSVAIDTSPYDYGGGTTHGSILQLPDGTVLLPVSCYGEDQRFIASDLVIYRSKDRGRTWGEKSPVCFWGWEASLLRLHSGRLMIAVRYQRCEGGACVLPSDPPTMAAMYASGYPKDVYIARSDDGGHTWKDWQRVTGGDFDAPGQLLQLSDGRLLLLYAHRAPQPAPCGTWAMVSRDEGRTWEPNRYIVNGVCHRPLDWGYSASVVMKNGLILTLSGCRGDGWPDKPRLNQKYPGRIVAIRWKPE